MRAITNSERKRDSSVMMSSVMPSVKYSCSGSPLMLGNGSTAIDGLSGRARAGAVAAAGLGAGDRKHVDRPRHVLERDLALVLEADIELVAHLIVDLPRDRNAARLGDALDAGSDVDAVAHQIIALHNDVADMDADAQRQFPLRVGLLDCLRRLYRLHGTGKLNQEAVADCLEQPAGVLGDRRLDDVRAAAPASWANVPASSLPTSFE